MFTRLTHVREETLQNRESHSRALLQGSYGLEVPCTTCMLSCVSDVKT